MTFWRYTFFAAALAFAVGCAGSQNQTEKQRTGAVHGFDGAERLPEWAEPTGYYLDLEIDPTEERFKGTVEIEVELSRKTGEIYLHGGERIRYDKIWVAKDGEKIDGVVFQGDNDGITVSLDRKIDSGTATLHLSYNAPLDETPNGLYRVKEDERWYAFTQFEPLEARTAFPSFDEPRFKTRFDVEVTVPRGMQAFTNTPDTATTTRETKTVYEFAESKPMPTYLVAFAVGDFDVVKAPATAMGEVPFRIITTKGKADLAAYALEKSPPILAYQEEYFGIDMPYKKLDFVAVPNFRAGAMENIGLVTYRESILLLDPDGATTRDEYRCQSIIAHELAHMWFGNYVTPTWWDDLWLNESFATWMATKTLNEVAPELEATIDAVRSKTRVMSADALEEARAIRQPVKTPGDVYNAFDGITYSKGAAVLRMVEAWVGEETFQEGLYQYLQDNAHETGTTKELLSALDEATGKPVSTVMRTFIDQPGTPLVGVDYSCGDGTMNLTLTQKRYLPAGSGADADKTWSVPVCVRYGYEGGADRACMVLEQAEQTFERDVEQCPAWLYPNDEERGYYRWSLPDEKLAALLEEHRGQLRLREKVALLSHLSALTEAQMLSYRTYLDAVHAMKTETHRAVISKVVGALFDLEEHVVARPVDGWDQSKVETAFTNWVQDVIGPDATRLGFEPRPDEPASDKLLRPKVIRAAAFLGGNEAFKKKAREVVESYFENPGKVDIERLELALKIAAHNGDEALWQRIRDGIATAPTPSKRVALIGALGRFSKPDLVQKSLDEYFSDDIRSQDTWTLVGPTLREESTAEATWAWFTDNFDKIVEKVGKRAAGRLPWLGSAFCSEERKEQVAEFWEPRVDEFPGTQRNLAKALESIERCYRFHEYVQEDAAAFLYDFAGYSMPGEDEPKDDAEAEVDGERDGDSKQGAEESDGEPADATGEEGAVDQPEADDGDEAESPADEGTPENDGASEGDTATSGDGGGPDGADKGGRSGQELKKKSTVRR
jgi:alanyl aminopeptidase